MRRLGYLVMLCALSLCYSSAQIDKRTEAQIHGFEGPVKSAVTNVQNYGIEFQQPEGPAIVIPEGFRDIEFDLGGNMTRAGEILPNGNFFGTIIQNILGADGKISQRISTDFASGQLSSQVWYGPFGATQSETYMEGKLFQRVVCTYEDRGLLADIAILDANGTVVQERLVRKGEKGEVLEEANWGYVNGDFFYERINNQEDTHLFQRWGKDDGRLRLQTTTEKGKVVSFWSADPQRNQWGSTSTSFKDHANAISTSCRKGGLCTPSHVHYKYVDKTERDPKTAEWTDSNGVVVYAAYYDYVFDSHQNWIRREIRIVSPQHPDPTLYETDSRTITYW